MTQSKAITEARAKSRWTKYSLDSAFATATLRMRFLSYTSDKHFESNNPIVRRPPVEAYGWYGQTGVTLVLENNVPQFMLGRACNCDHITAAPLHTTIEEAEAMINREMYLHADMEITKLHAQHRVNHYLCGIYPHLRMFDLPPGHDLPPDHIVWHYDWKGISLLGPYGHITTGSQLNGTPLPTCYTFAGYGV
jgi:hypothetical protein